jgi:two-component system, chemotaxis family, protein-glutamate methylesterase/glutaminase
VLQTIASRLPQDFPAAIFVVSHVSPDARSRIPDILNRAGDLPAAHAADGEVIRAARIYVAPPDRHLLIRQGKVRVTRGPREGGHRPAIDPLFRSAAREYGSRVVGVILSGTLDDGAHGIRAIKEAGGIAVVQSDAEFPDMPRNAIAMAKPDHVVPQDELGDLLVKLAHEPATPAAWGSERAATHE